MTVVYLDSVFLFNALIDYLLVLAAARLAGIPLHRGRYAFCGLLGGLYAAAVFLPGCGFLAAVPVKMAAGVLLALVSFGGERHFLRLTMLTFAIACALAGTVLGLGLLAGQSIPHARGVFYTNVNGKTLLISASGLYVLLAVLFRGSGGPWDPRRANPDTGFPDGTNRGPYGAAGYGPPPAGHLREPSADGGASLLSAAGGRSVPITGCGSLAAAAPEIPGAAPAAAADPYGGRQRPAAQRKKRLGVD